MESLKNRLNESFVNETYTPPKGIEFGKLSKNRVVLFTKDSTKKHLIRSDDSNGKTLDDLKITYKKGDEFKLEIPTKNMNLKYDLVVTGENSLNYTTKENK